MYLADQIQPGLPLVLTEGEFDALTAWQVGWDEVSAASIGSASNRRINRRWYGKLLAAPHLPVCMDADEAGVQAATKIAALSNAVRIVRVPTGKDMNEFYLRAGKQATVEWLVKKSACE
ncbi:MAG: toprim domain-containing protein [Chloroflexota bacterium]